MINYFNVEPFKDKYLITNDLNEYAFIDKAELYALVRDTIDYDTPFGKQMVDKGFAYSGSMLEYIEDRKYQIRSSKSHMFRGTSLHIFVLTNICNLRCIYCQAKAGEKVHGGKMSFQTAEKAVQLALESPEEYLTFEFQGGEPLENFGTLRHIIEYTEENKGSKHIEYNLVSNLTLLTDEILQYLLDYHVNLCCSVDGNKYVHDMNRKYHSGRGSFEDVRQKINLIREKKMPLSAIQTTTRFSLDNYKQIVDSYIDLGFNSIFLRPLTPLGDASCQWDNIGYSTEEFVEFYRKTLEYIIQLNKNGIFFSEGFATIVLRPVLKKQSSNYMELRSPCGATVGQLAYYFDGNIYTCDEGRMLAEMGDSAFCLGNVETTSYNEIMDGSVCKAACAASILESTPKCCDCVYQSFCGICPVLNYALDGDIFPKGPGGYKCLVNKGMLDCIFEILYKNDPVEMKVLLDWVY